MEIKVSFISICIFITPWKFPLISRKNFFRGFLADLEKADWDVYMYAGKNSCKPQVALIPSTSLSRFGSPRVAHFSRFETRSGFHWVISKLRNIHPYHVDKLSFCLHCGCGFVNYDSISTPQPPLVAMRIEALACYRTHQTYKGTLIRFLNPSLEGLKK